MFSYFVFQNLPFTCGLVVYSLFPGRFASHFHFWIHELNQKDFLQNPSSPPPPGLKLFNSLYMNINEKQTGLPRKPPSSISCACSWNPRTVFPHYRVVCPTVSRIIINTKSLFKERCSDCGIVWDRLSPKRISSSQLSPLKKQARNNLVFVSHILPLKENF